MTLHDVYRNACERKKTYREIEAAERESARLNRIYQTQTEPYRCPFGPEGEGGHWHVGHPPSKRRTLNDHLSPYRRRSIETRMEHVSQRHERGWTRNHWENNYREDVGLLLKIITAIAKDEPVEHLIDTSGGVTTTMAAPAAPGKEGDGR